MRQRVSEDFVLKETTHPFVFENPTGDRIIIYFVKDRIIRVRYFTPTDSVPAVHSTFQTANYQGTCIQQDNVITFETKEIRLVVTLKPAFHLAFYSLANPDTPFVQDLAFRAYGYDITTQAKFHYQKKRPEQFYYGLGEKSGALNLAGRRFRLERLDCMGYDAETSDPLYKFCPYYISLSNKEAYGIYYNNFSRSTIDLGQEIDAMWGHYTYYQCDSGPLDYYVIYGPSVPSIVQDYSFITSRPRYLPPRFSLGYLASSMGYAESENAQSEIERFVDKCIEHDIPCDGIHLSSGYTVNEKGDRCVFTWNKSRFPNPKQLAHNLDNRGIKIFANIKPWLLQQSHPDYESLESEKGLVWDEDQPSGVMQWRGGRSTMGKASYIDFTSESGYNYWKSHVKSQLLEKGYMLWLDNNEFTMPDDGCTFACQVAPDHYTNLMRSGPLIPKTKSTVRQVGSCVQTLLMIQASYEAVVEHDSVNRPFLITRSATPYANELVSQTWSGDNTTAWKTIKYNIPMGLGAGLSNMPAGYGHDIGGFAGPKPDPEMFVRWVQQSVFWPRFSIHSWNTDGTITEPWMYSDVTPVIRSSIHFRYKLIPYLYTLYVQYAYYNGEPLVRPVFYHHQYDTKTYDQGFEFMLGPSILIAPVYEPKQTTRELYLPAKTAWYHYQSGDYFETSEEEGQRVTVDAPLDSEAAPFFVKAGSMLCFGKVMKNTHAATDDERRVQIFPERSRSKKRTTFVLYEDDGDTLYHHTGKAYAEIHVWMETTETEIFVGLEIVNDGFFPYYDTVWVTCPIASEKRKLVFVEEESTSKRFSVRQNHTEGHGLMLSIE